MQRPAAEEAEPLLAVLPEFSAGPPRRSGAGAPRHQGLLRAGHESASWGTTAARGKAGETEPGASTEAGGREAMRRGGKRRAPTRPRERPGPAGRWDRPRAQAPRRGRHRPARESKADGKGAARRVETGTPAPRPAAPSLCGPGKAAQRLRAPAKFGPPRSP